MDFENRFETSKMRMFFFIILGLAAGLLIYPLLEVGNYSQHFWVFLVVFFALAAYFALAFMEYNFIWYSFKNKLFRLRFYNSQPFFRKRKSIEIPLHAFEGVEIKKTLGGLKTYLIVKQNTIKGIYTYPPVSVGLMKKTEIEKLISEQKKLAAINRSNKA